MISMRGQAGDYDHWRQLGSDRLGLGRRAAGVPAARRPFPGRQRASRRRRRDGAWRRRGCAGTMLDAIADAADEMGIPNTPDFNTGDNTGVVLFPRQPEARPALVGGARLSEAGAEAAESAAGDRRAVEKVLFEGRRAAGVRLPARQRDGRGARQGRGDPVRGRHRLGAGAAALGRRPGRMARRARYSGACMRLAGVGRNLQDHLQLRVDVQASRA